MAQPHQGRSLDKCSMRRTRGGDRWSAESPERGLHLSRCGQANGASHPGAPTAQGVRLYYERAAARPDVDGSSSGRQSRQALVRGIRRAGFTAAAAAPNAGAAPRVDARIGGPPDRGVDRGLRKPDQRFSSSTPSPWRAMNRAHGADLMSEVRDEASWQKSR